MNKYVIMIPTYNESESIKSVLDGILDISLDDTEIEVLVIDDNSPDKTADLVDSFGYSKVRVLRRPYKDGLGNAYKAAIKHLLADPSVTHLVSMDADGSHMVLD